MVGSLDDDITVGSLDDDITGIENQVIGVEVLGTPEVAVEDEGGIDVMISYSFT